MSRLKNGGLWVAAVSLVAGMLISPVSAHVNQNFGHLWGTHIKPKVAYEVVEVEFTVAANDSEFGVALCPEGKRPTGGGVSVYQPNNAHSGLMRVIESYPRREGDGWEVFIQNDRSEASTAQVYAICTTL